MGPIGADVRVVGVGGAGGNVVRRMMERGGLGTATMVASNTDAQALVGHPADIRLVLGKRSTAGLGAGGRPSVGLAAARETMPEIQATLEGADLVFVAAGMGGGTGTGAAPLIAHVAREMGALVVGVVTVPFGFEGGRRARFAEQGIVALEEQVDSLLVIENERLLDEDSEPSVLQAFSRADAVLVDAVRGIGDLVLRPGLINLDFADVAAVLMDGGRAVMGVGKGRGVDRALRAVEAASRCPLLSHGSIEGAAGVLMSFTVDPRLGIGQIHQAAAKVQAEADDDAEILFGVCVDPNLDDEVQLTLVASGVDEPGIKEEVATAVLAAGLRDSSVTRPYAPGSAKSAPTEAIARRRRNALVMLS